MIFQLIFMSFKHFAECRFFLEPQNINFKRQGFSIESQVLDLNDSCERSSPKHDFVDFSLKMSSPGDNLTLYVYLVPKIDKINVQTALESVHITDFLFYFHNKIQRQIIPLLKALIKSFLNQKRSWAF